MKYKFVIIVCMFLGIYSSLFASEAITFLVVVHTSNPRSEMTKEEISNLFLKKITRWEETGKLVYPVNQLKNSPARKEFSRKVHEKKIKAIKAYWQQQIFSGRKVPPVEKYSDQEILEYVARKTGAVGYVSASADISGYKVKAIELTENK